MEQADAWGSPDGGRTWQLLVSAAPFGPRGCHAAAVVTFAGAQRPSVVINGGAGGGKIYQARCPFIICRVHRLILMLAAGCVVIL